LWIDEEKESLDLPGSGVSILLVVYIVLSSGRLQSMDLMAAMCMVSFSEAFLVTFHFERNFSLYFS
jgi:hypothetical protein